jgi:short-subunit dehydrogenase
MAKLTALITGASGGIGLEIAQIHAENKYDLLLVARNEKKLHRIKNDLENKYDISVWVFATDLTRSQNITALLEFTEKENIRVDHLINNAGMGVFGKLTETSLTDNQRMIDLNINALVILTHAYAKKMISNGAGKILNIASTAAFMPGPYMSIYFASKAFVLSFGESVNSELEGTGVSLTTLCPGPTQTGFVSAAEGMDNSGLFSKQKVSTPRNVATDGFYAMMRRKPLKISGLMNVMVVFILRFSPRSWVTFLAKGIIKPIR